MKNAPPRQFTLDLENRPAYGREDFLVSPSNEAAFRYVDTFPSGPERRMLLVGPPGSGKTHLAMIFSERLSAANISAASLREQDLPSLLARGALVVEDADRLNGRETELFHLLNLAAETRAAVLMTARAAPAHWGIGLPDLLSRLRLLPAVEIEAPDDALLRAVIVKHFVDRQLAIDTSVVETLARHIDRSLEAARTMVEALDREALARSKPVTRALVMDLLGRGARDNQG